MMINVIAAITCGICSIVNGFHGRLMSMVFCAILAISNLIGWATYQEEERL